MSIDMITSVLNIKICDSVEEAPEYSEEHKLLKIDEAIVVCRGTKEGNPTVDLQLKDEKGNRYLVMATGGIIENLGAIIKGARIHTTTN